MFLELTNTVAALVTVSIVAATAIAALIQLRHLRAANQINALLAIGEKLNSPEFTDAITTVSAGLETALADPEFRNYEIAIRRRMPPPMIEKRYADVHHACVFVGNTFELIGSLVKNGIVDQTVLVDQYCGVALGAWKRLANYTALGREAGDPSAWEYFEYLAVLSENWLRAHPSSYPKGVRRYPLHTPWPLQ